MTTFWILFALVWGIVWGALCASIMYKKGYDAGDVVLYFVFGLFLTFIAALLAYSKKDIKIRNDATWICSCGTIGYITDNYCQRCGKTNPAVQNSKPVPKPEPAPQKTNINAAEELKQFKELLDMGAITEEEYNAKKKQLLGL